jgi:phosphoribosyl 1,2-cyclic phosphate phosphodiesterase
MEFKSGEQMFLDCGPDWTKQMEAQGLHWIEHILLTHPHHDHVAGLPEWADACRWLQRRGKVYAPLDVIEACQKRYPWLTGHIDFIPIDTETGMKFAGWQVTPWRVCHGKNGYSYAYRLESEGKAWVYCSDAINLSIKEKQPMKELDLLVLGTSFYKEEFDFSTRSVYDIVEGMALVDEMKPQQAVFTHMSHDVDLRKNYPLQLNVQLAVTGKVILIK